MKAALEHAHKDLKGRLARLSRAIFPGRIMSDDLSPERVALISGNMRLFFDFLREVFDRPGALSR